MLSYTEPAIGPHPLLRRRAMSQLQLFFLDSPVSETRPWDRLDDQQKRIVIETLARLKTQATCPDLHRATHE
jgi:hypothetical protein